MNRIIELKFDHNMKLEEIKEIFNDLVVIANKHNIAFSMKQKVKYNG